MVIFELRQNTFGSTFKCLFEISHKTVRELIKVEELGDTVFYSKNNLRHPENPFNF